MRRPRKTPRREALAARKLEAVASFAHRLASCFATGNWPRATTPVEEAAKLLHEAYPAADPLTVARTAFVVVEVRALAGKPPPSPVGIILTLRLVKTGQLAPSLLERLSPETLESLVLFSEPPDATWLERVRASISPHVVEGPP